MTDHKRELPQEDVETLTYYMNMCQICRFNEALEMCKSCRKNMCFDCIMKH